jgi:ArsR family transcriptional regulator, zinc-responsive transcriptional repressor
VADTVDAMDMVNVVEKLAVDDKKVLSDRLGQLFSALAHPARARIVQEIGSSEKCVNDLAEILNISHSSVSQHLAILRSKGLIKEQKAGRFVFYRLVYAEFADWVTKAEMFV